MPPAALLTPSLQLCSQGPPPGALGNSRPVAAAEHLLVETLDHVYAVAPSSGEATQPTLRVSNRGGPFNVQRRPQARSACPSTVN